MWRWVTLSCLICFLSLRCFTQDLGNVTIYNTDNSELIYNQINSLEFDAQNRLWIGTPDGLSVLDDGENWFNFNNSTTPWCYLPTNVITALEWADNLSMMFIGTSAGITDYWDAGDLMDDEGPAGAWCPAFGSSCSPNTGIITSLLYADGIWAGSTDGLCVQYLGGEGNWLLENTESGFYSNNITSIKQNPNNDMIAIGTMNGGLVTYDNDFSIYYTSNSDILDNTVFDVAFDQNNNTIICTPQAGLGILTENGSWIWLNTLNSTLPTNSLKNVVVDNNNNLWIATLEDGLAHYTNNTFYNYTVENSNLPDNNINCLLFGPNNHLWLGTENSGVVKINTPIITLPELASENIHIYPTIFKSHINIEVPEDVRIKIFNHQGQLINNYTLLAGGHKIDTYNYDSGVYFMVLKSDNYKKTCKLIKRY